MNKLLTRIAFAVTLLLGSSAVFGQANQQVIPIPLSRPGEPVTLDIELMSARIEVIGEDRDDAEVSFSVVEGSRRIITPSGPKSLSVGSYALEIDEDDNHISVDTDWRMNKASIVVRLPKRADLRLGTVNDGEIIVRNITGDMQLENVNGPITATNVRGSVIAEAINQTIDVSFSELNDSDTISFTSVNGDLKIGLAADEGAQLHIDTARGEIYSDFEVEVQPNKPIVQRKENRGGIEVLVESVIIANVNGGGPIVKLKSLNGDIHINKN